MIEGAVHGVLWALGTVLGWFGWETDLIHRDEAKPDARNFKPPH
jgi:hypothetical protein